VILSETSLALSWDVKLVTQLVALLALQSATPSGQRLATMLVPVWVKQSVSLSVLP